MLSAALPVFATVMVCGGLVVETVRAAKLNDDGVMEMTGASATPVPDTGMVCGLPTASLFTETVPERGPEAVGVNVTWNVQLSPAGRGDTQDRLVVKSPVAVTEAILSGALPELV